MVIVSLLTRTVAGSLDEVRKDELRNRFSYGVSHTSVRPLPMPPQSSSGLSPVHPPFPPLNSSSIKDDNRYMIDDHKLDFWIQQNMNVLFSGKHGVGKTTMVIDAFNRNSLKWMYFSAATMDPWVDFIGVPKEMKDEQGSYLGTG